MTPFSIDRVPVLEQVPIREEFYTMGQRLTFLVNATITLSGILTHTVSDLIETLN